MGLQVKMPKMEDNEIFVIEVAFAIGCIFSVIVGVLIGYSYDVSQEIKYQQIQPIPVPKVWHMPNKKDEIPYFYLV